MNPDPSVVPNSSPHASPEEDPERLRRELEEAQALAHLGSWHWVVADNHVAWSNELYRIYGLDPQSFGASFEAYLDRVHPDDRARVKATIGAVLGSGGPFDFIERVVRPDGEVRWLRSRGRAETVDGRVSRLIGTCQDITDQRLAEAREHELIEQRVAREQAERAREDLRRIFEQAPAAIAVLRGPELVFETVNPRFSDLIGGFPVLGRSLSDLQAEGGDETTSKRLEEVFRTGERYVGHEMPSPRRHPDGTESEGWFDFVYEPLRDADGKVDGVMIHAVDVTEKIQARVELEALAARLKASNEELEQFAYVASHDLRAPLRGIANLGAWIEEDADAVLPAASREHLALLRGRVERLDSLIDGILQYSRAARQRFEAELVDLGPLVEEVRDLLGAPAQVRYTGEPLVVRTERLPLQQILQNLVSNGIKHGGEAATVAVSATRTEEGLELAVTDDGPGIEPRYQDRIWGIFQTLRPRDEVEGSGIGLSIVKKTVESRGGRVTVESAPGHGATFRISWPLEEHRP